MSSCCESKCDALAALRARQSRVLKIVLAINAVMFVVEVVTGLIAGSSSVLADALDMFGDAVVYASSLYVLSRGAVWQARMAVLKGSIMVLFGIGVLGDVVLKALGARLPSAEGMGAIGIAALAANLFCLYLLTSHRADDINMRSVWLCSRNDIIANIGVLLAAAGVRWSETRWPDVLVGTVIAAAFLSSAWRVLREAFAALRGHASALRGVHGVHSQARIAAANDASSAFDVSTASPASGIEQKAGS